MSRQVALNGKDYPVQRFKALKAVLAIASVTRISREVPDILARALKEYSGRNTITLTREMAKLPRWQDSGFTPEDFDANDGRIELPAASMSSQEQIMVALPELFDNARKETVRLLAILVVPNDELRAADKEGGTAEVNDLLDKYEDLLLYDCEIDEIADLVIVAYDVLDDQLSDKRDRLGKIIRTTMKMLRGQLGTHQDTQEPTPSTSTSDSPTSSTDLPTPTVGPVTSRSTEPVGLT